MADFEIEEVIFCKKMNDSILIRLTLFLHIDPADYPKNPSIQRKKMLTRKTVLEISISKIREKKLSVILG